MFCYLKKLYIKRKIKNLQGCTVRTCKYEMRNIWKYTVQLKNHIWNKLNLYIKTIAVIALEKTCK